MLVNKAPFLFFLTAATVLAGVRSAFPDDQTRQLVESLSQVSRCHNPTFSPDGRRIVMICDLTGTPQVWTVNARGGWPSLVTNSSDAVTTAYWSPGEDWIAFSRSAHAPQRDFSLWTARQASSHRARNSNSPLGREG